eukprot:162507-Pleurochrysis_carterae.AAC.1
MRGPLLGSAYAVGLAGNKTSRTCTSLRASANEGVDAVHTRCDGCRDAVCYLSRAGKARSSPAEPRRKRAQHEVGSARASAVCALATNRQAAKRESGARRLGGGGGQPRLVEPHVVLPRPAQRAQLVVELHEGQSRPLGAKCLAHADLLLPARRPARRRRRVLRPRVERLHRNVQKLAVVHLAQRAKAGGEGGDLE